jgi:SPP1 gp7 family putative phage head morphogenesis protein
MLGLRETRAAGAWRQGRLLMLSALLASAPTLQAAADGLYEAAGEAGAPHELADAVYRALVIAELSGRADAAPGGPLGLAAEPDPFQMPFEEAVAWWQQQRVLSAEEWDDLGPELRYDAFRVAGVTDRRVLEGMHAALHRAIEDGTGLFEFAAEVDALTEDAGANAFGLHHLRTIFDTNVASAYMAGRYAQMVEGADSHPFWRYHAIDDGRTRPSHAQMDGLVARWDDPVWSDWWPPNGFNCRCTVSPLTEAEAAEEGYEAPPQPEDLPSPDNGFARSPALAKHARDAGNRVASATDELGLIAQLPMDRERLAVASRGAITEAHRADMNALARSLDADRLQRLKGLLPVTDEATADLLRQTNALNFFPPGWDPSPSSPVVVGHMYSQDKGVTELLARRLVYSDEFTGLRRDLEVSSRVSAIRDWMPGWDDSTEAFDWALGQALGDSMPVAWSSEVSLAVGRALPSDRAGRLAVWMAEQLEDDPRGTAPRPPVPLRWGVGDVRVYGPIGSPVVGLIEMVLNVRSLEDGWQVATLSGDEIGGWSHHRVLVSQRLAELILGPGE